MSDVNPFPFTRPQVVDHLPVRGVEVTVVATEDERRWLAETLDIVAVDSLTGTFTVTPWRKTGVKVTGFVDADVRQACVVTLEPVAQHVHEDVEMTFLPDARPVDPGLEIEVDPNAPDEPEPLEDGRVDLGAIAAEHMALGLDPYPRAPGAVWEDVIEDDGSGDEPTNPFAGLGALKKGG
jgi:uncharacterized metal-binding protein YceD (DUF177 family)